jgi:glutamate carboxypeptidase
VSSDLQDAMVDAIGSLVRIESPTSDVSACSQIADVTQNLITEWLGTPARASDHGGRPVVRWGPEQPAVLLLGHLDTVWPIGTLDRLPWQIEDDRMRGPGVFDMKTGIVMAIAAAQLLTDASDVGLLFTSDEETGSATSRDLIANSIGRARAVVVFEPAAGDAYKTQRKGTSWYQLTFQGRAAHAGLEPEAGINALLEAALFATDAATWANPAQGTTVTPTLLRAGTTANTVPDRAELTMDVRAWNRDEQERVDEAVRGWRLWQDGARCEVAGGIDRPALEAESSDGLYALAVQSAEELGFPAPDSAAVGGASDGNLTAAAGVPTLDGMGACGDGAHADHEWASIAALVPRTKIAAEVIRRVLA